MLTNNKFSPAGPPAHGRSDRMTAASIASAGTFDGIVLSGVIAAYLA
jgi:hypothetical protein